LRCSSVLDAQEPVKTIAMSHVAIAEALDGKAVMWIGRATDEKYLSGRVVID